MQNLAYTSEIQTSDLSFTPSAAAKLAELSKQAEDAAGVRIFVSGGGCGGMNYGMTFTDQQTPYDSVFDGAGFKVLVDAVALNYLQGTQIDYHEDGAHASFVFNNVFKSVGGSGTCGSCGSAKGRCGG